MKSGAIYNDALSEIFTEIEILERQPGSENWQQTLTRIGGHAAAGSATKVLRSLICFSGVSGFEAE